MGLWVDALRSGAFEQGTDKLKTDETHYCCLGVLDEVKHSSVTVGIDEGARSIPRWMQRDENIADRVTPDDAMWIERYTGVAMDTSHTATSCLTALNDSGVPFDTIADVIEHFGWEGDNRPVHQRLIEDYMAQEKKDGGDENDNR